MQPDEQLPHLFRPGKLFLVPLLHLPLGKPRRVFGEGPGKGVAGHVPDVGVFLKGGNLFQIDRQKPALKEHQRLLPVEGP